MSLAEERLSCRKNVMLRLENQRESWVKMVVVVPLLAATGVTAKSRLVARRPYPNARSRWTKEMRQMTPA